MLGVCAFFLSMALGILIGRASGADHIQLLTHSDQFTAITNAVYNGKLDINLAGVEELISLEGIGEITAHRIIAYRQENGPYTSVLDLLKVEGIGEKKLDGIIDYICVGG